MDCNLSHSVTETAPSSDVANRLRSDRPSHWTRSRGIVAGLVLIATMGLAQHVQAAVQMQQLGYLSYNGNPLRVGGSFSYSREAGAAWAINFISTAGSLIEAANWQGDWFRICTRSGSVSPSVPHCGSGPWIGSGSNYCYLGNSWDGCNGVYQFPWTSSGLGCPTNSALIGGQCVCSRGYSEDASSASCKPLAPAKNMCSNVEVAGEKSGNPIVPATADKVADEVDLDDGAAHALVFRRTYRSTWARDLDRPPLSLTYGWSHNLEWQLDAAPASNPTRIEIANGDGQRYGFVRSDAAAPWVPADGISQLTPTSAGGWDLRRSDDSIVTFTANGRIQALAARNGWTQVFTYDVYGRMSKVTNAFGRSLAFTYRSGGNGSTTLASVRTLDGRTVSFQYDTSNRLSSVSYPDGKKRTILYEVAALPYALTGTLDEGNARFSTYVYDTTGRATSTENAGAVNRYQMSYPSGDSAAVTDPLGTSRTYSYGANAGKLAVTGGSLPSGTGGADAASRVQDANGLITSETDFNGVVTTTSWDTVRRLPLTVTRGSGAPEAVTTTTQWHSTFSLPLLITEPGRTTSFSYDTAGNLLSKTVTDTGSGGGGAARTWSWTYNTQQLVATATESNGAVTTYGYDNFGNVLSATNSLGHVTGYTYDTANRVATMTAPNGLVTTYTYDLRDRLLTQTVGGVRTTAFVYNPTGTLATLSLPTGLVLSYTYDGAHRLTGWSNNRGESGTYTLDGMGNRTAEQVKDASGAVALTVARSINNINRVYSSTEGSNQTNTFGYDANGDLTSQTNALNQSTRYGLDSLRRVKTITNAANATASLTRNGLDDVTQATDFKGVATSYGRDALGNATSETSADSGARSTQYDALGLPSQVVDALGQATQIQRDALGRPIVLTFADGKSTTLTYDTAAVGKGYLAQIVDRSGTTDYTRDAFGRVTLKRQTLLNGQQLQVGYSYLSNGLLASITYPGGGVLGHGYDATGRLASLSWNGNPLVSAIGWSPLGQPTGWSWAFVNQGLAASRAYDTAARLTATEFSSYIYNGAGRITSLTQQLFYPADSDPTHSSIASGNTTWAVSYDAVGRITTFDVSGGGDTASFGYDANGNRASSTKVTGGQTFSRTYSGEGSSNRLLGFTQTGAVSTSVTYGYNANGDLTSDGLRSFAYNAEGRLSDATTGAHDFSPTTRYAHNALGQRVFKTEPQYPPAEGDENDPGFFASLVAFFTKMWAAPLNDSEKLGFGYLYDEEGTLLAEIGTGGATTWGSTHYIYLPTASGPLPVAAIVNNTDFYAVHADHLNTPRRLTDPYGQPVWQWAYSAFGEEKPTLAKNRFANLETTPNPGVTNAVNIKFNLRYPGQYFDEESGLHYNYFRSFSPTSGRYTQADPIGLDGGWNRFGYALGDALGVFDDDGMAPKAGNGGKPVPIAAAPMGGGAGVRAALAGKFETLQIGVPGRPNNNFSPIGSGRTGAFNEAKRLNNVPTSMCPSEVGPNIDRRGNVQPGRAYHFDLPSPGGGTQRTTIRDDSQGHDYGPGDPENRGPHFNDPLKRHFDY